MPQTHYTPFTVNTGQVTGTLPNTPILVTGVNIRFAHTSNGGHVANLSGSDLVWYADSNLITMLDYDLVSYNSTTGAFIFYVRVPAVVGLVIYLAYGDVLQTADMSAGDEVWNECRAVYYLGDGVTLSGFDATLQANNLTNYGGLTAAPGPFHGGVVGNGVGYLRRVISPYMSAPMTFQFWIKNPVAAAGVAISAMEDQRSSWYGYYSYTSADMVASASKVYDNSFNGTQIPYGSTDWALVTVLYNGWNSTDIYVNDSYVASDTVLQSVPNPTNIGIGAAVFNEGNSPNAILAAGVIVAQVRFITGGQPTAAQIAATYNAEKPSSTFWSFGSEVSLAEPVTAIRVTQDVIEVLNLPAPAIRASQDVIELISLPAPSVRATQYIVEVLSGAVIVVPPSTETFQAFVIMP